MAITKQVATDIVSQREQTWRINFEIPPEQPPSIQIYRETVGLDSEGNTVGKPQQSYMPINRNFADVEEEIATFDDGSEVTFGDILEALQVFGDKWAQEDAENPPGIPMPPPDEVGRSKE